jgi:hypothetical protein
VKLRRCRPLGPARAEVSLNLVLLAFVLVTHRAGENALLRSSDDGNTWQPVAGGPALDQLVAAADGDWSATKGSHFFRSLDDGCIGSRNRTSTAKTSSPRNA